MIHVLTWVLPRSHCSAKPASSAPLIIILGIFCPTLPLLTKIDIGAFLLIWGSIFVRYFKHRTSFLQMLTLRSSAHFIRYLLWNYRHQFPNVNMWLHIQTLSDEKIFKQQTQKQAKQDRKSKTKKACAQAARLDFHIWEYLQNNLKPGKEKIR